MSRCKTCGKDAWPNRFVCPRCLRAWLDKRKAAFSQAQDELGLLTKANHKAIVKRTKELERKR